MYVYVYIYIYMNICMYMYTCVCTHIYIYILDASRRVHRARRLGKGASDCREAYAAHLMVGTTVGPYQRQIGKANQYMYV